MSEHAATALRETLAVADVPVAFSAVVEERFASRPGERFVMLLSGGDTAAACYARTAAHARIDWSAVDLFMGDERMVPPEDRDANQRLVRERLVAPVGGVGSFTPMPTEGKSSRCATEYDAVLRNLVEGPGIDLIHLGLGPDGHTASLFPGAPSLGVRDRLVVATADPNGRNPHERLSVTYPLIESARLALFTVEGEAKRDALRAVRAGADLPAGRVRAREIRWLADEAAMDGSVGP